MRTNHKKLPITNGFNLKQCKHSVCIWFSLLKSARHFHLDGIIMNYLGCWGPKFTQHLQNSLEIFHKLFSNLGYEHVLGKEYFVCLKNLCFTYTFLSLFLILKKKKSPVVKYRFTMNKDSSRLKTSWENATKFLRPHHHSFAQIPLITYLTESKSLLSKGLQPFPATLFPLFQPPKPSSRSLNV